MRTSAHCATPYYIYMSKRHVEDKDGCEPRAAGDAHKFIAE